MNQWTGTGNMLADPEVRLSSARRNYAKGVLVISRGRGQSADYVEVRVFSGDRSPERHLQFADIARKGKLVLISGRLTTRRVSELGGETLTQCFIIVDEWEAFDSRAAAVTSGDRPASTPTPTPRPAAAAPASNAPATDATGIPDW